MHSSVAAAPTRTTSRLVLVVTGTDFHPFDRLVTWVDEWLADCGHTDLRTVVQYGTASAPVTAEGSKLLRREELDELLDTADLVVSHGGPATITEIRARGILPIVVPRDPTRGEHVDGHQQRFARRMGASGFVHLAETREALIEALERGLADPGDFAVDAAADRVRLAESVQRTGQVLDELIGRRRRRWRR